MGGNVEMDRGGRQASTAPSAVPMFAAAPERPNEVWWSFLLGFSFPEQSSNILIQSLLQEFNRSGLLMQITMILGVISAFFLMYQLMQPIK
jgi:hypothetical protein